MVLSEALVHLRTMRAELCAELHGERKDGNRQRIPAPGGDKRRTLNNRIEAIDTVRVVLETMGD